MSPKSKSTMVNARMDDDTIEYLDLVGPTRSDAIRKCIAVAQRDHTVEAVRSTPVKVSRLGSQREHVPGVGLVERLVESLNPQATVDVPRATPDPTLPPPPVDPVSGPTAEYLELKEKAREVAVANCPHPIDERLGQKPGPVRCGRCYAEL